MNTYLPNTVISSSDHNDDHTALSNGTGDTDHNSLQRYRDEAFNDHVISGGVITDPGASLTQTTTALVAIIDGWRSTISATAKTYTASKDTYVDVLRSSTSFSYVYTEVANGAASPALASNSIRIAKVVTNGTEITGSTQYGYDSLGNPIRHVSAPHTVSHPYQFSAQRQSAQNSGNGAFAIVNFATELFDPNNNFDTSSNVGRYTAPVAGTYIFTSRISAASSTQFLIALYKNGSIYNRGVHTPANGTYGVNLAEIVEAAAGDYFEIYSFGSGGALEISSGTYPTFSGCLLARHGA